LGFPGAETPKPIHAKPIRGFVYRDFATRENPQQRVSLPFETLIPEFPIWEFMYEINGCEPPLIRRSIELRQIRRLAISRTGSSRCSDSKIPCRSKPRTLNVWIFKGLNPVRLRLIQRLSGIDARSDGSDPSSLHALLL
jgi:hypothetical protein